jgi:hypothetical protein
MLMVNFETWFEEDGFPEYWQGYSGAMGDKTTYWRIAEKVWFSLTGADWVLTPEFTMVWPPKGIEAYDKDRQKSFYRELRKATQSSRNWPALAWDPREGKLLSANRLASRPTPPAPGKPGNDYWEKAAREFRNEMDEATSRFSRNEIGIDRLNVLRTAIRERYRDTLGTYVDSYPL